MMSFEKENKRGVIFIPITILPQVKSRTTATAAKLKKEWLAM